MTVATEANLLGRGKLAGIQRIVAAARVFARAQMATAALHPWNHRLQVTCDCRGMATDTAL